MKRQFVFFICIVSALFFSCNTQQSKPIDTQTKLVFHFELDSAGNITNEEVKQKLIQLAREISRNADRLTLNAYSEETGSKEKNEQIASDMSYAAKRVMLLNAERAYYNVGYANPINPANPADIQNRRIEFTYIK